MQPGSTVWALPAKTMQTYLSEHQERGGDPDPARDKDQPGRGIQDGEGGEGEETH